MRREAVPDDDVQSATNFDESPVINQGTSKTPLPALTFHEVHGANIQILRGGRIAKRKESFCKGLAFSSRPIQIDERVCIRFAEVVTNWSGVLRFGVTNVDPSNFRDVELPKFACPDLTSKDGYWAKALPERYSVEGSILHFYVTTEGELYYGINGVLKGQFLNGINVTLPIWVIVDIYGNSSSLEFVDPSHFKSTRLNAAKNRSSRISSFVNSQVTNPGPSSAVVRASRSGSSSSSPNLPISRYHPGVAFSPLAFHSVRGKHVTLSNNYTVAERYAGEYSCGYVFTSRPLEFNEKIVIQVLDVETAYTGSLAFGLTCCDPINIQSSSLPADSDDLLERSEYWVGIKDVGAQLKPTDELSFWITERGEVYFAKNNAPSRVIIHVDTAVRLWAFFDVYGSTQRIRLLGSVKVGSVPAAAAAAANVQQQQQRVPPFSSTTTSSSRGGSSRDLLDLSSTDQRPIVPSRAHPSQAASVDLTQASRPSSTIAHIVRSGHGIEENPRRTQSETGARFNTVFGLPIPSGSEFRPVLSQTRERDQLPRSLLNDSSARPTSVLVPSSGDALLELLENIDASTNRPSFPAPMPVTRNSPSRGLPARPSSFVLPPQTRMHSQLQQPHPQTQQQTTTTTTNTNTTSNTTNNVKAPTKPSLMKRSQNEEFEDAEECKICMSAKVNCVIYTCGHMSMCYECATQTWHERGECPICRKAIEDVIRIYKA